MLRRVLPQEGLVLEVASGTGQHAAYFSRRAAGADLAAERSRDAAACASIEGWAAHAGVANVLAPLVLDAPPSWGIEAAQAVVCINMIHIAPWTAAQALFAGAGRLLPAGGVLHLYGPYRRNGEHTAPSNAAFDAQLRNADPEWGVRNMEDVAALGQAAGFRMWMSPSRCRTNNFSLGIPEIGNCRPNADGSQAELPGWILANAGGQGIAERVICVFRSGCPLNAWLEYWLKHWLKTRRK
ncbi:DUF938 domain-containing protein [Bradyrhizobium betae]